MSTIPTTKALLKQAFIQAQLQEELKVKTND